MHIERLEIRNLRIIEEASLELHPGMNLFTGGNGAGKTTLLEAAYLLGNGRSFRHPEAGPLLREGSHSTLVTGELRDDSGKAVHLGVERRRKDFSARKNGEEIRRRSELLRQLPLLVLLPTSHQIVEKGPELRRQFLDQGLFHVEQHYHQLMLDYSRALKQRNAALRMQDMELARSFNPLLVAAGERLTGMREQFIVALERELSRLLPILQAQKVDVLIRFLRGWSGEGKGFAEALKESEGADLKQGYTTVGPHRADIRFLVDNRIASKVLSRGQQKLLVYGVNLGYLDIARSKGLEAPVLLLDDIESELDQERVAAVLGYLEKTGLQALIATLSEKRLPIKEMRLFHVEHGRVSLGRQPR